MTAELKKVMLGDSIFFKYNGTTQTIKKYYVKTNLYYDLVKFSFKEESLQMEKGIGLNIFDVFSITPEYVSRYDDGVLGLAPYDPLNPYL
jgi:hypothetical protein